MSWVIDDKTQLCVGVSEPYGVHYAARAVADDVKAALRGAQKPAVDDKPGAGLTIFVAAGVGDDAPESFTIRTGERDGKPAVLIDGVDERGAIYGLYHLAHEYLGADPLKHITGYRPEPRDRVELGDIDYSSPPPAFRYRGWHVETCGLWGQWATSDETKHHHYRRVFETLMRCGGNMVKPDTNRPESMEVGLAQKMGLLITQEHAEPLACGTWELQSDDPTFNHVFDDHPHVFIDAWKDAILRYPDPSKVIWTLNYRGAGDQPFYVDENKQLMPRYDTAAKRGEAITRVLNVQHDLVMQYFGDAKPQFIHNTWMEGNVLMAGGHVKPPEDTCIVWSDNIYGTFRSAIVHFADLSPDSSIDVLPDKPPPGLHGTYFHVAGGDFCAPFLSAYVSVDQIEREFRKVYERGMMHYQLLNMQYAAPQVLGVAAIADIWRDPDRWFGPAGDGAEGFLRRWCKARFGDAVAEDAARCYRLYYASLTRYADHMGYDEYIIGNEGYARAARDLVRATLSLTMRRKIEAAPTKFFWNMPLPMPLEKRLDHFEAKTTEAAGKWAEAIDLAQRVADRLDGRPQVFFRTDVLCQMEIYAALTRYLQQIIAAIRAYEATDWQSCRDAAAAAMASVDDVFAASERRDWGEWKNDWDLAHYYRIAALPMAYDAARMMHDAAKGMQGHQSAVWLDRNGAEDAGWRNPHSGPAPHHPHRPLPEADFGA